MLIALLRCLGHVLRMPNQRSPRRAMFSCAEGGKKTRGGQTKTALVYGVTDNWT